MKAVRFDWDAKKAGANLSKHGVTFEQAIGAFDDPFAMLAPDEKHSTRQEERFWLIGCSAPGVLVVVFTKRDAGGVVRIISARKASRKERLVYEAFKTIPLS